MALVPAREREAFDAHWKSLLANDDVIVMAIEDDGRVAGNVLSWTLDGRRVVGYWLGREFWGRGLATKAVGEFVELLATRPLHAWGATGNGGSRRGLGEGGFGPNQAEGRVDGGNR